MSDLQTAPASAFHGQQAAQARAERLERLLRWLPGASPGGQSFEQVLADRATRTARSPSSTVHGPRSTVDRLIADAARRHGVDVGLVRAVVQVESGFNPQAVSRAGAKGLMQLMDGTARSLGVRDSFDPAQNLDGGVRYLKSMLQQFGSLPLALAAYNAGPGAVQRFGGIPPYAETQAYVTRVTNAWRA